MKGSSLVAAGAFALSGAALAQTSAAEHAAHHPAAASGATRATLMAEGEVRKIDQEQGKITLKHGPIVNLDMPGMTMVFKVADPKMLDNLKQGDKVRFLADTINGALTVTAIEVSR